jgi:hypothetical protein
MTALVMARAVVPPRAAAVRSGARGRANVGAASCCAAWGRRWLFALLLPWLPRPVLGARAAAAAGTGGAVAGHARPATPADPGRTGRPADGGGGGPAGGGGARSAAAAAPAQAAGERDDRQPAATGVGLLALKQQLAQIHGAPVAVQLQPRRAAPAWAAGRGRAWAPALKPACRCARW